MYSKLNEMRNTPSIYAMRALASALTTAAIQAVKIDLLNRQFNPPNTREAGEAASLHGEPTLDQRARHDDKQHNPLQEKGEGTAGDTNAFGGEILMPPLHQAELLDGMRTFVIEDGIQSRTEDPFFLPQGYKDRIAFLCKDDMPLVRVMDDDRTARLKRLKEEGKITDADIEKQQTADAKRFAAPFQQHGPEILVTLNSLNDKNKDKKPDDSWFDQLPYRIRLQLIDKTANTMKRDSTRLYLQSVNGGGAPGTVPHDLEVDARLIEDAIEGLQKFRIAWFKENKAHLDAEQELFDLEQTRRLLARMEARSIEDVPLKQAA
jgi:hypothetical protein